MIFFVGTTLLMSDCFSLSCRFPLFTMRQHNDSDTSNSTESAPVKRGPGRQKVLNNNNNNSINNNMMRPVIPASPSAPCVPGKLCVGQEVIARWNDGLCYLGNILKVRYGTSICIASVLTL